MKSGEPRPQKPVSPHIKQEKDCKNHVYVEGGMVIVQSLENTEAQTVPQT